jgi:hypothetical protein
MGHYLLVGAGFSRNWGGPLSEEVTGSLLGELHDDAAIVKALRNGPFEDAFAGFHSPVAAGSAGASQARFQKAVVGLFSRLNKTFVTMTDFEFTNDVKFSVKRFLAQFDAIFSLNQDLLLEIHYMQTFSTFGKWNAVVVPGMQWESPTGHGGLIDLTQGTWTPTTHLTTGPGFQPLYKLHGSSNWRSEAGEQLLIMGNAKTGAIGRFPVLRSYHEAFAARLNEGNSKLMVIGYSFQDDHINEVIERASREHGLGIYLVNPSGRAVLRDPKLAGAAIYVPRSIEGIKLVGEQRRLLSAIFRGDSFAHGELMRFFS